MTLAEEFKSRNFSIYGQWTGVLCIIICLATGISAIFSFHWHILFGILAIISGLIIIFIEIPLLLRICPMSDNFTNFIRRFETNMMRSIIYFVMSVIQWLSITIGASALVAAAVFLLFASVFYLAAGIKGQGFVGSKTLGGQGIAAMVV